MSTFARRCVEATVAGCLGIVVGFSVRRLLPLASHGGPKEPTHARTSSAEPRVTLEPDDSAPRSARAAASFEPSQRASSPPAAEPPAFEDDMREADRMHEREHEEALQHHRDEPRDPNWAAATEQRLEAELGGVAAAAKFKVVRVDCRTTTCVSVLEWRSYREAVRSYGATLRHAYTVNCGQEVLLLPPSDPAAPYEASMIFDCESWRAAGN